jgi:hypothetical protein
MEKHWKLLSFGAVRCVQLAERSSFCRTESDKLLLFHLRCLYRNFCRTLSCNAGCLESYFLSLVLTDNTCCVQSPLCDTCSNGCRTCVQGTVVQFLCAIPCPIHNFCVLLLCTRENFNLQTGLSGDRMPISVVERSKARVCGRSLAGVAGSNTAGGMDVCVVYCTVKDQRQSQDTEVWTKHKVAFTPEQIPWYLFLLEAEWTPGVLNANRRIRSLEKFLCPHLESKSGPPVLCSGSPNCATAHL